VPADIAARLAQITVDPAKVPGAVIRPPVAPKPPEDKPPE
jgi:hypothetical protein